MIKQVNKNDTESALKAERELWGILLKIAVLNEKKNSLTERLDITKIMISNDINSTKTNLNLLKLTNLGDGEKNKLMKLFNERIIKLNENLNEEIKIYFQTPLEKLDSEIAALQKAAERIQGKTNIFKNKSCKKEEKQTSPLIQFDNNNNTPTQVQLKLKIEYLGEGNLYIVGNKPLSWDPSEAKEIKIDESTADWLFNLDVKNDLIHLENGIEYKILVKINEKFYWEKGPEGKNRIWKPEDSDVQNITLGKEDFKI